MRLARTAAVVMAAGVCLWFTGAAPGAQNVTTNGSFESGGGGVSEDPHVPAHWTREGNVIERSSEANLVPVGGGFALKAFQSNPIEQAYQEVPVSAGDQVRISAMLMTYSVNPVTGNPDKLGGDALAGISLRFFDGFGFPVGSSTTQWVLDASSPADTWLSGMIGPVAAPTGAAVARMRCVWSSTSGSGAAFWDDAQLTIDNGPNLLLNGDFEEAGLGSQSPNGIDYWTGFEDQEQSTDYAYDGTHSLKVGTTKGYSGLVQEMGTLADGDHIIMKVWLYQSSTNGLSAGVAAGPKLEFYEANPPDLPAPTESLTFNVDSNTNSWELVNLTTGGVGIEVPADATQARLDMIYVPDDAGSNGTVYFDAVYAAYSDAPAVNLVQNASFEDGPGGPDGLDSWVEFNGDNSSAEKSGLEVPGYPNQPFESCLKVTGTDVAGVYQDIDVVPGKTITLSAYLRKKNGDLVGTARAGVKIEWRGGSAPANVDICDQGCMTSASPKDQWVEYTIDHTMPAGSYANARFTNLVAFAGAGTSGTVYFDAAEAVVLNRFPNGDDSDGDYDSDLYDFYEFQQCFFGNGVTPLHYNCLVFDHDGDEDIDLADYDFFLQGFTGPLP